MKGKIKYTQFLNDASEIKISNPVGNCIKEEVSAGDVNLVLPVTKPPVEVLVIEIFLK
jgi:alpha-L-fucosidase